MRRTRRNLLSLSDRSRRNSAKPDARSSTSEVAAGSVPDLGDTAARRIWIVARVVVEDEAVRCLPAVRSDRPEAAVRGARLTQRAAEPDPSGRHKRRSIAAGDTLTE